MEGRRRFERGSSANLTASLTSQPGHPLHGAGRLLWSHRLATMRFHGLLNSLFKVLCNFPSRYLFAIGLARIFSLRWSLPPVFEQHSQATLLTGHQMLGKQPPSPNGPFTRSGLWPRSMRTLESAMQPTPGPLPHSSHTHTWHGGFRVGLFPLRSPLLRES